MRFPHAVVALALCLSGCSRSLELPAPPPPPTPPGPGSVSGKVVIAQPGRSEFSPAAGASVELLSTSLATRADSQGRFLIEGISRTSGDLLFRYDQDGDGAFERQRLLRLEALQAGPGRFLDLGEIPVGENAQVRGRVLRSDVAGSGGHAGSLVFVPEGPFTAVTADDGSFVLRDLPAGSVRVAYFRAGYGPKGFDAVAVEPGQEVALREVTLEPVPGGAAPGALRGRIVLSPAGSFDPVRVSIVGTAGAELLATPDGEGAFSFPAVAADVYLVSVTAPGYRTARVNNFVVLSDRTSDVGEVTLDQAAPGEDGGAGGGAGGGGGGGGPDGGVGDGGSGFFTPTARTGPPSAVRTATAQVRLDGSASSTPGGGPLVYRWTQVGGLPVVLSANDSLLAATPTFNAPERASVLLFELTVTNGRGLTSPPAIARVEVVEPPVAAVDPPALSLRVGTSFALDARRSTDPTGSLLGFAWSVQSGAATIAGVDGGVPSGPLVILRAPPDAGTSTIRVVASNAYVSSDPVHVQLTAHDGFTEVLAVDAGLTQFVGTGEQVVLSATAATNDPSEALIYQWRQVPVDGGAVVALDGSTSRVASFTAPGTAGRLEFTVDATSPTSDSMQTGFTAVEVIDDKPPRLVASDPVQATGGTVGPWLRLTATFDEPLDLTSVIPANFAVREGSVLVPVDVQWNGQTRTVTVIPHRPLKAAVAHTFTLSGVRDLAPFPNTMATLTLAFTPRAPAFKRWSTSTGATEPRPVVAATDSQTWVVGWTTPGTGCTTASTWAGSPNASFTYFDLASGMGACVDTDNEGQRAAVVGSTAQVLASGAGVSYPLQYGLSAGAWSAFSGSTPNILFGDGATIGGMWLNAGFRWISYANGVWTSGGGGELIDAAVAYVSGNDSLGGAIAGDRRLAVGLHAPGRALRVFESVAGGAWTQLTETTPTVPVYLPRASYAGADPAVCFMHDAPAFQLSCAVRQAGAWRYFYNVSAGSPGRVHDLIAWPQALWVAYSKGGSLELKEARLSDAAPAFTALQGPAGGASFNDDPACAASRPQLFRRPEAIWLTWQESCAGSWRAHLLRID